MALSATFVADFKSFNDAVEQSDVKLKSFQDDASKVESALTRMSNSLSGTRIIQDATLMAEAVDRVGGISKLTEAELARVSSVASEASAKLVAMGQEVPPGIQNLANAAKGAGDAHQTWTDRIKDGAASYVAGMITYDAFIAAGRKIIDFLKDSVAAAAEAEAAEQRLTVAVENQGAASPALVRQYDELAKGTERVTAFSDSAVKQLEVMLVQVGNILPSQMGTAVKATTDLASAMGIDLAQAGLLVSKAAEGNTTSLQKMGVTLDDTRVKSEGLEYVIGQIEERFGGQAQAELSTYSGQVKQLGNQWEATKEQVGRFIIDTGVLQLTMKDASVTSDLYSSALHGNAEGLELVVARVGYAVTGFSIYKDIIDKHTAALAENERQVAANGSQYATAAQHAENLALAHIAEQKALDAKAEADKKAAEAVKKHDEAIVELATFSQDYHEVLKTLNATTVEEIQNYITAGASLSLLQEAYHLTAGQIQAISAAREADIAMSKRQEKANEELIDADQRAIAAATKLWGDYGVLIAKTSGSSIDIQIADIHRWEAEQSAAFEASKGRALLTASAVENFYAALTADVTTKLQLLGVDQAALTDAATNHSKEGLQQIADAAQRTYDIAKQHVGEWSEATIEKFRLTAQAAQQAANEFGIGFANALDPVPAKVDKITDAAKRAADAVGEMIGSIPANTDFSEASRNRIEKAYQEHRYFGPVKNGDVDWEAIGFPPMPNWGGARAMGGPVDAGKTYLVGEQRPELFTPSSSGWISPNVPSSSGTAGVVINLGGIYVTQPLATPEAIGGAVSDSLKDRLSANGIRWA